MFLRWLSRALVIFSKASITLAALVIFLTFSAVVISGLCAAVDAYNGSAGSPDLSL